MKVPDNIQACAYDLGFEIVDWDESGGVVRRREPRVGATFVGSHAEIVAYLQAWQHAKMESSFATAILPIRSGVSILPGTSADLFVRPSAVFRGCRAVIPDAIAPYFVVDDVKVGNRSQLLTRGGVPAVTWAARLSGLPVFEVATGLASRSTPLIEVRIERAAREAFGGALDMETCQLCTDIVVSVTCVGGSVGGYPFEMAILGHEALPRPVS